jgi:hypothetical protein
MTEHDETPEITSEEVDALLAESEQIVDRRLVETGQVWTLCVFDGAAKEIIVVTGVEADGAVRGRLLMNAEPCVTTTARLLERGRLLREADGQALLGVALIEGGVRQGVERNTTAAGIVTWLRGQEAEAIEIGCEHVNLSVAKALASAIERRWTTGAQ